MLERLARLLRIHQKIKLLHLNTGRKETCTVLARRSADGHTYEVEIRTEHDTMMTVRAADDYEEALEALRVRLEERSLLLLINRYRRNAFVSTMARQMSDGLACYLVQMGRPVSPRRIVSSIAPAPARVVVTLREADAFVEQWIDSCK